MDLGAVLNLILLALIAIGALRGTERQELRVTSYGMLWAQMRPLAIYDDTPVDRTSMGELSKNLSDWYFSEKGGLMVNDDLHAAAELEHGTLGLPAGLEISWLGVSGYRLTYDGVSIFIDPYVSRVPLRALLLRRTALPDPQMIERYAAAPGAVAGILVGHTHWDHAVDAPALARRYSTKAYGSASLVQLMRLHGLTDSAVEVAVHKPYELGPFVVSFVPSRHSKLIFGRKVPMDGPLTCDHLDGLAPGAYKCGAVYGIRIEVAGISIYHQGSANVDDAELRHEPVDIFLAGVAGRQVTPHYWERVLPKLDPRVVVPTHYDNFFSPLGTSRDLVRRIALAEVPDEVHRVTRDAQVAGLRRVDAAST